MGELIHSLQNLADQRNIPLPKYPSCIATDIALPVGY